MLTNFATIEKRIERLNQLEKMEEDEIVNVTVRNTNKTLSQTLKNFFYTVTGNDTYTISASSGGMVVSTGENNE